MKKLTINEIKLMADKILSDNGNEDLIEDYEYFVRPEIIGVQHSETLNNSINERLLKYYPFKSSRDKRIFELYSQGLSYQKIAKKMGLKSPTTVARLVNRTKQIFLGE